MPSSPSVRLAIDLPGVSRWLSRELGYDLGELEASQFDAGQSNPTYLLTARSSGEQLVLRRKPPGELLPSAHDVVREHRVLAALQHTDVPVPRVIALCTDDALLGVPWYAMRYVPGRVLEDIRLPGCGAPHSPLPAAPLPLRR